MYTIRASEAIVRLDKGLRSVSFNAIKINLPIKLITFYIINASAPFLLSIQDIDKSSLYFKNTINELIKISKKKTVPIV